MTHEVFLAQPNSLLAIVLNHFWLLTLSILCCNSQLWNDSILCSLFFAELNSHSNCMRSSVYNLGVDPQKSTLPALLSACVLFHGCREVFTAPLHSNANGAGPQRTPLATLFYCFVTSEGMWRFPLLRVYGPLPSNCCFSASTFLLWANRPQYIKPA
jgi:hypothetical protein